MAVVRALDLDDVVTTSGGACHSDRVHRGFGAGVGEAHLFEAEPAAQLLGEGNGDLGCCREVGTAARGAFDGFDDLGVRVADDHATEPIVVIDSLLTIDIPHLASRAVVYVDGVRIAGLEARCHAERKRAHRPFVERARFRSRVDQLIGLFGRDLSSALGNVVVHGSLVPVVRLGQCLIITCLISV